MSADDTMLLAEVADVLAAYGDLRCAPRVEAGDNRLVVTLEVPYGTDLRATGLYDDLRYVTDMAQVRMLATRYNIDASSLEKLLPANWRRRE